MPPTRTGNKRVRFAQEVQEQETMNQQSPSQDWSSKMAGKFLAQVVEKQQAICKKEQAIRNLEEHKNKNTVPKSMKITVKVQVSTDKQGLMDEIITNATQAWEQTVMNGLLRCRKMELDELKNELSDIAQQYQECLNMTYTEMITEELMTEEESRAATERLLADFRRKSKALTQTIRSKDFFARKEQEDKRAQRRAQEVERNLDRELQDPEVAELKKKVQELENQLKSLPKNDKAKPDKQKKAAGGGKNGKGQGNSQGKAQGGNAPKGKGKGGNANANRKRQRPSKPSTRQ